MECNIAIVNSSSFGVRFPEHLARLEELGSVTRVRVPGDCHGKELAEKLKKFNIIIASVTPFFDAEFFENKRNIDLISRHGIGYNNVDIAALHAAGGILTTVSPRIERDAVAEAAIAILMDCMRQVSNAHVAANKGLWKDRASFVGNGLTGKTLGIIGCGNIGTRVVEILSRGFNMRVVACDPVQRLDWAQQFGVEYADLDTVLSTCNVLTLNADLNPTSFHILDERALAKMKHESYVVNNARADLIDQQAMLKAIDAGIIRGLAIDVMHDEPPLPQDPYFNHPKVLVTCHISAYTEECLYEMGEKCTRDVERFVAGQAAENEITSA